MAGAGKALALHVLLCFLCRGVARIKCQGSVWIEPALEVLMGSNISINCISTIGCSRANLSIQLNSTARNETLRSLNSSAAQLRLHDFRLPYSTVLCFDHCRSWETKALVCGTEVWAGYPPEPPGNLTCTIGERSGSLACTWDAGRPTHLRTDYRLHLNSTQTAEEEVFPAGSPVPLSALRGGSRYSAWVQARNALGAARSAPRHLDLRELVVPALPLAEGAETTLASPPITTVRWRQQTQLENVHCEERHRAEDAPMWHVEAWDRAVRAGHPLQSDTRYVFQARCRLSPADSPWSAWSPPFVYTTPEAAPAAAPDVWRRLGPAFPNGSHEVTVLIKPLPPRAARGRILGYAVAAGSAQPLCNTSGTSCSVLVPPGVRVLHVTAHNSWGASSPANVTLGREAGQQAFPAPAAVEVRRQNQSSVSVAWQPPRGSRSPPLWFIVEWVSTAPYSKEERFFWKKVPCQDTLTYIQEDAAAASHINVSVYAVYPDGVSKPTSGQVSSEERIPDFSYNETSHDDDTGVFLGMGVSVIVSSVVLAILMFKKSARIRIKATVASLLPKWLLEDFPHMENSNVIKSLQEKSEFTSNSSYEPFQDDSDPTVMEIEEVSGHEKYKIVDIKKKPSTALPENVVHPQSSAPAVSAAPEHVSDYKPQISDGNLLGYVAANIYQAESHTPAPEPETTFFFRDYTSPVSYLWNAEGAGHNVCLLEKINLILNNNRSGQNYAFSSAQEEQSTLLESQWGKTLSSENVQEQTLVPDELVSCLRAMNEEPVDIQTCLQQRIGSPARPGGRAGRRPRPLPARPAPSSRPRPRRRRACPRPAPRAPPGLTGPPGPKNRSPGAGRSRSALRGGGPGRAGAGRSRRAHAGGSRRLRAEGSGAAGRARLPPPNACHGCLPPQRCERNW